MPNQMADASVAGVGAKPRVLLSYAKESSGAAEQLRSRLAASGYVVRSADDIAPGGNILDLLANEVDRADFLVPLISHHYLSSETAAAELTEAIVGSGEERSARIIPVLLDDSAVMPPLLRAYQALGSSGSTLDRTSDQLLAALESALSASSPTIGPLDPAVVKRNIEMMRRVDQLIVSQQYNDTILREVHAESLRRRLVAMIALTSLLAAGSALGVAILSDSIDLLKSSLLAIVPFGSALAGFYFGRIGRHKRKSPSPLEVKFSSQKMEKPQK